MEIDTDPSYLSLTSSEDGSLRSECLSVSSEVLSLANACLLNRTAYPVPTDGNLHLNVTGTGVSMVSIFDTKNRRIPLYLLKFQYPSSVDIDLHLQKNRKQVISTYNNDALKTGVNPNKNTQVELTILEGHLTASFTLNDKTLLKQTCEMTREESAANTSEVKVADIPAFHPENDMIRKTGDKLDTDDDEDLETNSDDEYDYEEIKVNVQSINAVNIKVAENDADDDFSEGKNEIESVTSNDANDVDDNRESEEKVTAQVITTDNKKDFKDDVSNADKKKIESNTDDDTEYDRSWYAYASSDDELSVSESANDSVAYIAVVPNFDAEGESVFGEQAACMCVRYQANYRNVGSMGVSPPEKHNIVDIKTHRIDLLKLMKSDMLADYFFEAGLISEDNMIEINELFRRYDKRMANRQFLQILRNRRVPKHKIEAVLSQAEELHLLELMFPNQSNVVSVAIQTEDSSFSHQIPQQNVMAILNYVKSPVLNFYGQLH